MQDDTDILTRRLTLPELADLIGRSTSWLRDVRARDQRFPAADESGRCRVVAVVQLLHLRDLENMTDLEFNHGERARRANVLTAFDQGGPLASLGAGARSAIAHCTLQSREAAIDEARRDFERFSRAVWPCG
jgi:hypothetical protein